VSAAEAAATSLVGFSRVNPDNIPVYFHASGPIVKEVSSALQKEYTMASTGVGFFEDEIEMLRNTVQNIIVHDRPVITSREAHAGTAIIVGSGPSVDSTMEVLRKHAESAFVIAAGTAVETLLTAGVRVDCCVILERGKEVSEVFDEVSQRLDMSSVTLVGSSTIQSDLERHFRAGIYFFRPGLNIVRGFATGTKSILYNCDPTVSNTAAALAHFLGFRSILLFGVDMGSVHEHRHHSSQTAYYTSDVLRDLDVKMPVSVLATFGGMARTNFIFNWARDRLEEFIESHPDTDVILIGEGARIKGTVPVLPEAADMLDAIYPIIPIDEDLREVPAIPYDRSYYNYDIRHLEDFTGRLHDIIQEFSWDTRHAMTEKVMTTLWKHSRRDPFQMIMRGSVTEMIWSALSLLSALDPEDRPQYAEGLRDALANAITMMEETIKSVLAEADEPAPNT
jgi:uncharacterized Rossmann fold enzyme